MGGGASKTPKYAKWFMDQGIDSDCSTIMDTLGVKKISDIFLLTSKDIDDVCKELKSVEARKFRNAVAVLDTNCEDVKRNNNMSASSFHDADDDKPVDSENATVASKIGSAAQAAMDNIDAGEAICDVVAENLFETKQTVSADGTIENTIHVTDNFSGLVDLSEATKEILGEALCAAEEVAKFLCLVQN